FTVNCPICGVDGTGIANNLLVQMPAAAPVAAAIPGLRIAAPAHAAVMDAPPVIEAPAASVVASAPARGRPNSSTATPAVPKYMQNNAAIQNNNFFMGILGAVLGAIVAVVLMVGFTEFAGFRFPLLGTGMGVIIGFGARLLYKGTSSSLGAVSAGISFVTIAGTLF